MRCMACGAEMVSARETYPYDECGLPHVILVGVEVRRCAGCDESEVVIPNIEGLHRVIAGVLVRKPARLTGAEVRFLRKFRGWGQADFAARIGVDKTTVSKWENGHEMPGAVADRLIRLVVALSAPITDYSTDALTNIGNEVEPVKLRAHADDGKWREEQACA